MQGRQVCSSGQPELKDSLAHGRTHRNGLLSGDNSNFGAIRIRHRKLRAAVAGNNINSVGHANNLDASALFDGAEGDC
jgi:hypothetical protein